MLKERKNLEVEDRVLSNANKRPEFKLGWSVRFELFVGNMVEEESVKNEGATERTNDIL